MKARLIFMEADDEAIIRRFSETRRPHPLGTGRSVLKSIRSEREKLAPIRAHGRPDHQHLEVHRA